MTEQEKKYVELLKDMRVSRESVSQTLDILHTVPLLMEELADPTVELRSKHLTIERIFPMQIRDFLKLLCDNEESDRAGDILREYGTTLPTDKDTRLIRLEYVTKPTDAQFKGIKEFVKRKYNCREVKFDLHENAELIGGFILRVGNDEYDWSKKSRIRELDGKLKEIGETKAQTTQDIINIIRLEIENFDEVARDKETGYVQWVGDGIANVSGIDHAMYGEIVLFDNGVKGMVQDIRRDEIGCILFGEDEGIKEGMRVVRTGKTAGVPVGKAFCGRVVNALGEPIDGKGEILSSGFRPIENEAPGIVDRKSVGVPLETGILAIDSMFPIGRGQRELIIGDRQTGKTSIAIDTILNQKGKHITCIYTAIGQKASTIAQIVHTLEKNEALEYTIVVAATASDPASLQYIAPYAATALAEYFMYKGGDVLIVYDDLSKHAVAYRALSLLLERSPGREAYPGDVFYLHSRLLERASRLSDRLGGGSITALPIIETQAGDVSAYIPTNVISITDGQIYLENDLFFSGQRPAVNVGLSVSRVGGAAQTKAMKRAAGSIRINLAQFREMEVFTQFSSDLDETTKEELRYGKSLMELLKQPLCQPMRMSDQVITLVAATNKLFADFEPEEIKHFQHSLLNYFSMVKFELIHDINTSKALSDDMVRQILEVAKEFKTRYMRYLTRGDQN